MADKEMRKVGAPEVPGTQALMRGIDVLMAIGMAPEPLRFADIQKVVQLPKGTLHRLLSALQHQRLLRFDERTRQYHVGSRVFDLARRTLDQSGIIRAAKPELSRISRLLGRSACLYVRDGDDVFVLDFEDADAASSPMIRIWPRQAIDTCAAGIAMLSALPAEQLSTFAIPNEEGGNPFAVAVDLSRALGYAIFTERDGTATSVAAAVLNSEGYPVAAISCPFDGPNTDTEALHEAGRALIEGARRASGNVGMAQGTAYILPGPPDTVSPEVSTLIRTGRDYMGENPVWSTHDKRLYWLDILAPALRSFDPATGATQRIDLPELAGGLATRADGRLILLGRRRILEYTPGKGTPKLLISLETARPDLRFNTASVDAHGNLWAGTMAISHEPGRGRFYRIAPDLNIRPVLQNTGLPKNAAWSLDGRSFYYADGGDGILYRYDCDLETGTLGNGVPFVHGTAEVGTPNGICVDSEGHVWAAMLGGWAIHRYAPDGRLVDRIVLPVPMPTSLCFGGEDLRTLYVTSTYLRLPPGFSTLAPLSGSLMEVRVDIPGVSPRSFGEQP